MALISVNNVFSTGATISASEHNDNFNTIYNDYNGNIKTANIADAAAITDGKLAQITTPSKVSGAALTSLASIPSGAGAIPSANMSTNAVVVSGDQTVAGIKTFSSIPVLPSAPTSDDEAASKGYVDNSVVDIKDYSTSLTTGTTKNLDALKIRYGSQSITADATDTFTNMPFTSNTSYVVLTSVQGTSTVQESAAQVTKVSGTSFTLTNPVNSTEVIEWLAIGT